MNRIINAIFPKQADNTYRGNKIAAYVLLAIALIGLGRSCIHLLAPDGGAGSIAGMDLSVAGAGGIIFAFSLWGSAQLLTAFVQLVVFLRYKTLIPFMYVLLIFETLLRMLVGHLKPVIFSHTPPGEIANFIILPVAIIMLILSIANDKEQAYKG